MWRKSETYARRQVDQKTRCLGFSLLPRERIALAADSGSRGLVGELLVWLLQGAVREGGVFQFWILYPILR